jgi:penicillin-binding protein 1A
MGTADFSRSIWLVRFVAHALLIAALAGIAAALIVVLAAVLVYPRLPPVDSLTHYRPAIPLRVYTADGTLIGEFGEEHRAVVGIQNVPSALKHAILAAEDARFYEHGAIDISGMLRSAFIDTLGAAKRQGASTITMQLVRNLYLSRSKTFVRKFAEVLLAYKVEQSLSKDQILERYVNQIYLGEGAYGFAAAAQAYFGEPLDKLTLAQAATLAGLPKAPSQYNPRVDPKGAAQRRAYVLGRMLALGYVDRQQYDAALAEPIGTVSARRAHYAVDAPYVAEDVRRMMFDQYGEAAYTDGFSVYTTLRDTDQAAADAAVRAGVIAYDRRHGYRGPEGRVALSGQPDADRSAAEKTLRALHRVNGLEPAVVLRADAETLTALTRDGQTVSLAGEARKFGHSAPKLERGAIIRLSRAGGHWELAQLPQAQAALVAVNPQDGAVRALCGGFDFDRGEFDHVTQAFRQPGSSFKPFVYSAALEKGFSPATILSDTPLVVPAEYPGGPDWIPHNYENDFLGSIPVREALAKSRNVATIRMLLDIGVAYARDYVSRFGLPLEQIPSYPSMALGTGSFTPLQMAAAYAVFANGGYRVTPHFVDSVANIAGGTLYQADPVRAGQDQAQVIDTRNAFLMTSMLQDVVRAGTAARAQSLGRQDLAGKTGTTENYADAWFDGYDPSQVAVAWIGFDRPRSLGKGEVGARAALPIWEDYMRVALKDVPDQPYAVPPGVVQASVHDASPPATADPWRKPADYFYAENVPPAAAADAPKALPAPGTILGSAAQYPAGENPAGAAPVSPPVAAQ